MSTVQKLFSLKIQKNLINTETPTSITECPTLNTSPPLLLELTELKIRQDHMEHSVKVVQGPMEKSKFGLAATTQSKPTTRNLPYPKNHRSPMCKKHHIRTKLFSVSLQKAKNKISLQNKKLGNYKNCQSKNTKNPLHSAKLHNPGETAGNYSIDILTCQRIR